MKTIKRSEVWLIDFEPTKGAEIRKIRPAVVVSLDAIGILPLKVVVPITDWKDWHARKSWMIRLEPDSQNGLTKVSAADTLQIRSVAHERFVRRLGTLSEAEMDEIGDALRIVLKLW